MQILRDRHLKENDDPVHLLNGRVHEAEGRDRAGFALFQAVRLPRPIVWVVLAHDRDLPMPGALPRGVAERLHLIEARPADLIREGRALESLRRWAGCYGPHAAKDGADGLIVDVSGLAHLFGGEEELLADVGARLERAGIAAKGAIAETRGGAWALARRGGGVIPEGGLLARLSPMPVSTLRIDANIAQALARLGLHRIGDLAGMARAPLAKRFGHDLLRRLDQALGQQAEPDPPHFVVRMTLPEPIGLTADVMGLLDRLLIRLCDKLKAEGQGARKASGAALAFGPTHWTG